MSDAATTLTTPELEGSVRVGSFGLNTEHAVAALGLGALGLLWFLRYAFPKP